MKKIFTFAAALLASLSMMAGELYSFTVTSATTAIGSYADNTAVLSGSAMATGGSNEVTVGNQTFYKFNSSTKWTFTLDEPIAVDDVITLTVASNASQEKKGKGLIINSKTLTAASIPAASTATITYTVVANDGIAGATALEMTRADSDIKFGTITITGDHTPVTKYTVTYMDGETVLGTESVKEGEHATKASTYEAKAHATFDGWYNDAAFTSAADFTAAITADKTFYGKWTADAFNASTSVNIEQGVLDNGKGWNFTSAFAAAHITYDAKGNTDELDSLNSSKDANNEPYLGLKLKKKDAYLEVAVNNGDVLRVKFGAVAAAFKVSVDGVESSMETSTANTVYELTATKAEYVRFTIVTDSKTVVFKQIKINEAISPVILPGNETNTKLATLTLDGTAIEGFAAGKTTYNITLEEGTAVPVVAATAAGTGAVVSEISQATAVPGAATFTVTAADGTTTATYTINFSYLSTAKVLTNVKFNNGAYGAIDEAAHTVTIAYMGTMPTVDATSMVVSEGANATVNEGVITVTAADASTQNYTIVGHGLVASAAVDEEITFDGTESYIYAHYGWDAEKGVKFAKKVDDATNMRIALGNTRIYMALPAAAQVVLTSGTGGARDVKIYVDGVEYTDVVKTAASGQAITINLNENAASFLMIESNQTSGDGGFTKMQLNSSLPTGINNLEAAKAIKVIENGQIVIIKNGIRYNAVGAKL